MLSSPLAMQAVLLKAAERSGGKAVGRLFLWCSRVLAEAQALKEEDELQEAREAESSQLSVVLEDVQVELEQCERDVAQMHGGSGTSADFSAAWRGEVCTCPGAAEQREASAFTHLACARCGKRVL